MRWWLAEAIMGNATKMKHPPVPVHDSSGATGCSAENNYKCTTQRITGRINDNSLSKWYFLFLKLLLVSYWVVCYTLEYWILIQTLSLLSKVLFYLLLKKKLDLCKNLIKKHINIVLYKTMYDTRAVYPIVLLNTIWSKSHINRF